MEDSYTRTATLADGENLKLDEPVPLPAGRVRVTVEVLVEPEGNNFLDKLAAIHHALAQSGHQPPTAAQVEAQLKAERDSWD